MWGSILPGLQSSYPCPSPHSGQVHLAPHRPQGCPRCSCARHCAGYLIGIILLSPPHKLIGQVLSSPLCKEEPEARGGEVASQVYSHKVAKTPSPPPLCPARSGS